MRVNTGGAVQVSTSTELWLAEIRAGRAFSGGQGLVASVGNFSELQLFNPVGSAITIVVRSIILTVGAASGADIRQHNTALATLQFNGRNLLSGGAAAIGEIRSATPAAQDGTRIGLVNAPAQTPLYPVPDWYIELGAGEGILLSSDQTNASVSAIFSWREV